MLKLPKGSLAVFDKGFTDYDWWQELTTNGIFFVTRSKTMPWWNTSGSGPGGKPRVLSSTRKSGSRG